MITTTQELEAKLNDLGRWYYTGRYAVYLLAQKYLGESPAIHAYDIVLSHPEVMRKALEKEGVVEDVEIEGHPISFKDDLFEEELVEKIDNAWVLGPEVLYTTFFHQVSELEQKVERTAKEDEELAKKKKRLTLLDDILAKRDETKKEDS